MCDKRIDFGTFGTGQCASRICSLLMAIVGFCLLAAASNATADETALVFHQYSYDKVSSEYIIRAFTSGTVIFTGKKNVRTLGERKFQVSPEQVEAVVNRLIQLRIIEENRPDPKIGPDNKRISLLEIRVQGENKSTTFYSRSLPSAYGLMMDVIDDAFPTRSL